MALDHHPSYERGMRAQQRGPLRKAFGEHGPHFAVTLALSAAKVVIETVGDAGEHLREQGLRRGFRPAYEELLGLTHGFGSRVLEEAKKYPPMRV